MSSSSSGRVLRNGRGSGKRGPKDGKDADQNFETKADNPTIFQDYDLPETTTTSVPVAGPSSRTRSAHNAIKSLASITDPSPSVGSNRKEKASILGSRNSRKAALSSLRPPDLPGSSKANGKRRAVDATHEIESGRKTRLRKKAKLDTDDVVEEIDPYMDLASTIARAHTDSAGPPEPKQRRLRVRMPSNDTESISDLASTIVRAHSAAHASSEPKQRRVRLRMPSNDVPPPDSISLRKRKAGFPKLVPRQHYSPSYNLLALPEGASSRNTDYIPTKGKLEYDNQFEPRSFSTPPPVSDYQPSSPIKRIKLIVRRPIPLISSPLQRPPVPKHNYSLSDFLSSYTTDGFEEAPPDVLTERARSQAQLLERAQKLRKEGHLLVDSSVLQLSPAELAQSQRTSSDIWHHCIEDVGVYLELKSEESSGKEITGQISKAMQLYWDDQAVKGEKLKAREERRLKALAKATIKMVTAEWKRAVFHLREQARLRLEAEEVKRGHAHLDAILDQSGQILETQQGDLSRADHSRSHSPGSSALDWDEEEEGEEEEDGEQEDEDEEHSVVGGEGDIGENTSRLYEPPHTRSPSLPPPSPSVLSGFGSISDPLLALLDRSSSPPPSADKDLGNSAATPLDVDLWDGGSSRDSMDVITPPNTLGGDNFQVADLSSTDIGPTSLLNSGFMSESYPSNKRSGPGLTTDPRASGLTAQLSAKPEPTDIDMQSIAPEGAHSPLNVNGTLVRHSTLEDNPPPDDDEGFDDSSQEDQDDDQTPSYLKPYIVAHVNWDPGSKISPPVLLRGVLRPYQLTGLEWLASLHSNNLNGILADEMGLGKTIQTIALLAHLACDRGIWGPHLIIVPTSVLLNWEMEFKKFLPGFKTLCYHGTTKRRKELRQGWNDKYHFNVCITSYTLAIRDAHIFKRKNWHYMILDESHMLKNMNSQRWNTLILFRSMRRLLLTGTPLQNNLTELWALLQFLMSGSKFANLKEFSEWFSNPLEKAIEMGNVHDDEIKQRVSKLHTVLRPYLLRRLKRDVEKELPSKYEHLVLCSLSKRQRFLYDEFMARAHTRDALRSGVYQKIANILMQLRKVCNHPDLFEVRPIITSFAMERSAIADYEIKELLIRRRLLNDDDSESLNLDLLGLAFIHQQNTSLFTTLGARSIVASATMIQLYEDPGPAPPKDVRTIQGFRKYSEWQRRASTVARWSHAAYLNHLRYPRSPIYSSETISLVRSMYEPILPLCCIDTRTTKYIDSIVPAVHKAVLSYEERASEMAGVIDRFAFITPSVVARDVARIALAGLPPNALSDVPLDFDQVVHRSVVKLSIAFPSPSLLQYDCGKLQRLTDLLREKKAGGHRVLLFTQMTKILDILEIYLNFHGYLYLRLDGATSIEDRQYVTERFNKDERIFCFIASSRSGGVGINLTGADTVIFYDSDFNPQMDRQCEDRAHRIGQIRDVHIYRFVSEHTVEEAMLLKANQKRSLDDLVIQKGEFDWRSLFRFDSDEANAEAQRDRSKIDSSLLTKALGEFEDSEDAMAARIAEREKVDMEGADEADFELGAVGAESRRESSHALAEDEHGGEDEGGTTVEYMLAFIGRDPDFFVGWRI
ncbi:SNF2 family N-terminal domain-containing protein [Rhodocollybia butyracea]|uniref:DNA helicase n=1 Tax=Rhodocollybia butyracea TaxID=206335 RepID=A0A9P5Q4S5_9AGAR|nr:SNF2 family N-terminal domain-containing protein [Rhodocollybia butyracea]